MSLNSRTVKYLEKQGYYAKTVERWDDFAKRRKDLFGVIDVLAVGNGETVAVQVTSKANISTRCRKIADSEATPFMRDAGWRILVHGWHKPKHRWELKEVDVS